MKKYFLPVAAFLMIAGIAGAQTTGRGTITMTQREAELLTFLCQHPDKILKREEILLHVRGKNDFFLGRSMDVFITRLRKFLAPDSSIVIETIHKVGYRFVVNN